MSKTFKIVGEDISDGYHTFDELYEHRCLLFVNICLVSASQCAWRPDFEGWFVLYFDSEVGQMSYHIPNQYLDLIQHVIPRRDDWVFDGHTSKTVANRLFTLAKESALALRSEK